MWREKEELILKLHSGSQYVTDFIPNNIGIFTDRQQGKTTLTALVVLQYLKENPDSKIHSIAKVPLIEKMDTINYVLRKNGLESLDYNKSNIKNFSSVYNLISALPMKIDIIVIDEVFYWFDNNQRLANLLVSQKTRGTKFIFNGSIHNYSEIDDETFTIINAINQPTIIDDTIIENLVMYLRNSKIQKIINKWQKNQ